MRPTQRYGAWRSATRRCSREVLARLAADPDVHVRGTAAGHPGLGGELLDRLLADDDGDVVAEAAANESLPAAVMDRVLRQAGL